MWKIFRGGSMKSNKKSWDYQKNRYKQVNIKFDVTNNGDLLLYHFITDSTKNTSALLKKLIYEEMARCAYEKL